MAYRPKHFKVHCSIQNHPKTLAIFDDDALLAMYVRCGVLAIERFADRTGESFLVNSRDLERLAGCRGVANARRKLGRLEANSPLTVGQEGAGYRLTFPNIRKKQGFQSEAVPKPSPSPTPTPTPTPTPKPVRTNNGLLGLSGGDPPLEDSEPKTPGPDRRPSAKDRAKAAWPTIVEAFAEHGKQIRGDLRGDRLKLIAKRLEDGYACDELPQAVHGYVERHGGLNPKDGDSFDPSKWFTVATIFKADGFGDRVDAGNTRYSGPEIVKNRFATLPSQRRKS